MVATKYMTKSFSLNFGSRIAKYPLDSEIGSLQVVFIGNSMKSVIKKTKQNKPKVFCKWHFFFFDNKTFIEENWTSCSRWWTLWTMKQIQEDQELKETEKISQMTFKKNKKTAKTPTHASYAI